MKSQRELYKTIKNLGPWVIVDMEGNPVKTKLKDHNESYREWKKTGKRTYQIHVGLSTEKFLAIVFYPRTEKQPEPYFKYEKITSTGLPDYKLVKDLGKGDTDTGGY